MITIQPILGERDLKTVFHNAKQDGHTPLFPTHMVLKGEDVVGFISTGVIPLLTMWLHTQKVEARDSFRTLMISEQKMRDLGHTSVVMACSQESPFYEYLPRLGYQAVNQTTLFLKNF